MSLHPRQLVEVMVEKPAAGGRMLARWEGQVLFVAGAIPGERIAARVDRVERQLAFGTLVDVLEPSPDRRLPTGDPYCGGCFYAHISYPRQLQLKAALIGDAFGRLGQLPLASPVEVASSPEHGYRMRARFHVEAGRIGFYREGSHDLCDARQTGHLRDAAIDAVEVFVDRLDRRGCRVSTVVVAENLAGDARVVHAELASGSGIGDDAFDEAVGAAGLSGCTVMRPDGRIGSVGNPVVTDALAALTGGRVPGGMLQRHARAFFQANRFMLPDLVTAVLDAVPSNGGVIDLYAGVGLFAVSLAAGGRPGVTAVEGDAASGYDLRANVAALPHTVRVVRSSVEEFLRHRRPVPEATIIVDPPRTGISREAMQAAVALRARRVVYVSCDAATMARDARRLVDGGYRLVSLQAFDLFPNTPHVEALGVFDRLAETGFTG